jgi:hypothetical protein
MLPDDDDKNTIERYEGAVFAFTMALAGLAVTLILAWVTA